MQVVLHISKKQPNDASGLTHSQTEDSSSILTKILTAGVEGQGSNCDLDTTLNSVVSEEDSDQTKDAQPVIVYTGNINETVTRYHCSVCNKLFTRKSTLYRHRKSHQTGFERCSSCNMFFENIDLLSDHNLKFHSTVVVCNICRASFTRKSNLSKHMRTIHSKSENNFLCKHGLCKATFSTEADLKDHSNIHVGIKPYSCHQCTRAFFSRKHLQRHEAQHSKGQQIKQCEVCGRTLKSYGAYYNHKQAEHKDIRYCCSVCNKEFKYKSGYSRHVECHKEVSGSSAQTLDIVDNLEPIGRT